NIIRIIFLSLVAVASCFLPVDLALATGVQINSETEAWVLNRITVGEVADLATRFTNERDRVLSASFLERLITHYSQSAIVHRHGIRITYAVFREEIDLTYARVLHPVFLESCHFSKKVDLSNSMFEKTLVFRNSTFEEADFNAMKVRDDASF